MNNLGVESVSGNKSSGNGAFSQREQVLDGALRCVARWGLAKTTLEDVGKESDISRATVYRLFPGGKTALFSELSQREVLATVAGAVAIANGTETLQEAVVSVLVHLATDIRDDPVMQYLAVHERDLILPYFSFDRLSVTLNLASSLCGPALERFVDERTAREIVEWGTRLLFSYLIHPHGFDLCDPDIVCEVWAMTNYNRLSNDHLNQGVA